jgi:hypothetical protein
MPPDVWPAKLVFWAGNRNWGFKPNLFRALNLNHAPVVHRDLNESKIQRAGLLANRIEPRTARDIPLLRHVFHIRSRFHADRRKFNFH